MKCSNPRCEPCRKRDEAPVCSKPAPGMTTVQRVEAAACLLGLDDPTLLIPALNEYGLAIVPLADVPRAEDRAVLEACSQVPLQSLTDADDDADITPNWYVDFARAELDRRAAKARP